MQPKNFQFGGGAAGTVLHPLVALAMLIALVLILVLPRRKAIAPFLLAFFTIPLGQVLVLGGIHLLMHQILILTVLGRMAGVPRIVFGKKVRGGIQHSGQGRRSVVIVFLYHLFLAVDGDAGSN